MARIEFKIPVSRKGHEVFYFLLTAGAFFVLGAFFQHVLVEHNIRKLIAADPYAFYIRQKIYDLLTVFASSAKHHTRMHEIMKYGFPGLDDLHFYKDFMLSYDRRNRVAHWVCEHLKAECLKATTKVQRRRAAYTPDMSVPSNFRVENADYLQSGYDRGHLAAAGNHKCSQTHCNETFYFTNIAPQIGNGFNRDAWNKLEMYVRRLTEHFGSVYVYTGPLYLPKANAHKLTVDYEVIGKKIVAVPSHFFKIIAVESQRPDGRPYIESYMLPNEQIERGRELREFLCDIKTIERYAGLKFFDNFNTSYFFGINYSRDSRIYQNFI